MNIVTIKEVKGVVTCAEDGTAEHVFNVKNATEKALKVGIQLSMDEPTDARWLNIDGSTEHELAVETMTQVSVKIQVPSECSPGKYSYRLRVYDPANPGEDYTDGDPVYFEVTKKKVVVTPKEKEDTPPFKWWIPVAIAVGVIVVGVVVWAVWPSGVTMPDFTAKDWTRASAEQFLNDNNVDYTVELKKDPNPRSDQEILEQTPDPDMKIKNDDPVVLKVAGVTVPQVTPLLLSDALQRISSGGLSFDTDHDLKYKNTTDKTKHGKVVSQDPPFHHTRLVPKKTHVKLVVGRIANKKFDLKQFSQGKTMKNIKISSGFVKREVAPVTK
jgi:beta-lactam-binding protein with PASTA domain